MRRRLYVVLPDVATTRQVVDDLLLARVDEDHIHVLGKRDTVPADLPRTSVFQRSDFVYGVGQGVAVGAATGAVLGLFAAWVLQVSFGAAIIVGVLLGAVLGGWASGMISTSVPNRRLRSFETAIERGELLLMADVPKERVDDISTLIKKHHPEAEISGTEPTIPAFP